MNIIIPMAGAGKRLRPHTLTLPKPLIPIAGKPMVQRIVEDLTSLCTSKIEEIHFVVGEITEEVRASLISIAGNVGAKGFVTKQDTPLGTGHAILCAPNALKGKVLVAFADTLFVSEEKFDENADGVIFVNKVENWQQFGVVKLDKENTITDFVEKPNKFVSDLAIVGIYYFKDGANLKKELQHLIDNDLKEKGEFQLTNAMENMKNKGLKFKPGTIREWLDCGNKDATVYTNSRILQIKKNEKLVSPKIKNTDSVIIPPCFIGDGVELLNSIVGPNVSIGRNTKITNSVVTNSLVQEHSALSSVLLNGSMIGSYVNYAGSAKNVSLGDYSEEK